jgi:hypothetical protein
MMLGLTLLGGCWHASPAVVFHTLRPLSAEEGQPALYAKPLAVEIMPVHLPELLQRSQIVLLEGPGTYALSETHRWGNTLELDMQRILAENLSLLLGSDLVVPYPLGESIPSTYRISLEVQRCDGALGGTLQFRANWVLTQADTGQVVLLRRIALEEPVQAPGVAGLVSAHTQVLTVLSRSIAAELKALPEPGK